MPFYKVTCITRDGADADRRIDGIGGVSNGNRWYLDIDSAIEWIETGKAEFYVEVRGMRVRVVVRIHYSSERRYLTTEGDSFPPNNLLNLPDCG